MNMRIFCDCKGTGKSGEEDTEKVKGFSFRRYGNDGTEDLVRGEVWKMPSVDTGQA